MRNTIEKAQERMAQSKSLPKQNTQEESFEANSTDNIHETVSEQQADRKSVV